jgi:integrase
LKIYTFHSLRHTFASWLAQSGVPVLTLKGLLGHESIQTTIIYAHLTPSNYKNAVEKRDRRDTPKLNLYTNDGTNTGTSNEKSAEQEKTA